MQNSLMADMKICRTRRREKVQKFRYGSSAIQCEAKSTDIDSDANGLGNENTLAEGSKSAWLANRSGSLGQNQGRLEVD